MKKFYVSLVYDLIGCYLVFTADSYRAVEFYLAEIYLRDGTWKLPWCSIYTEIPECDKYEAILIEAPCGAIRESNYVQEYTVVKPSGDNEEEHANDNK